MVKADAAAMFPRKSRRFMLPIAASGIGLYGGMLQKEE